MNIKELLELAFTAGETFINDGYFGLETENFEEWYDNLDKSLLHKVCSTLQVLPFEEDVEAITKQIHYLDDCYINADECGNISDKKYIGTELKKLRKMRKNL